MFKYYDYKKISPHPSFPKRGIVTPFNKGRRGGIFQLITKRRDDE